MVNVSKRSLSGAAMGFFIALVLSVSSVLAEDVGCLHCVAQLQAFVPKEAIRLLAQVSGPEKKEKKADSKTNFPSEILENS